MSIGKFLRQTKIPSSQAGYMELTGAKKDAGCDKVEVAGGVSKERGCCNDFNPESNAVTAFKCGTCGHLEPMK
jgi:hypothetical protein